MSSPRVIAHRAMVTSVVVAMVILIIVGSGDLTLFIRSYFLCDVDLLVIAEQLRHKDSVFDSYFTCPIVNYSSAFRRECGLHLHNI